MLIVWSLQFAKLFEQFLLSKEMGWCQKSSIRMFSGKRRHTYFLAWGWIYLIQTSWVDFPFVFQFYRISKFENQTENQCKISESKNSKQQKAPIEKLTRFYSCSYSFYRCMQALFRRFSTCVHFACANNVDCTMYFSLSRIFF